MFQTTDPELSNYNTFQRIIYIEIHTILAIIPKIKPDSVDLRSNSIGSLIFVNTVYISNLCYTQS